MGKKGKGRGGGGNKKNDPSLSEAPSKDQQSTQSQPQQAAGTSFGPGGDAPSMGGPPPVTGGKDFPSLGGPHPGGKGQGDFPALDSSSTSGRGRGGGRGRGRGRGQGEPSQLEPERADVAGRYDQSGGRGRGSGPTPAPEPERADVAGRYDQSGGRGRGSGPTPAPESYGGSDSNRGRGRGGPTSSDRGRGRGAPGLRPMSDPANVPSSPASHADIGQVTKDISQITIAPPPVSQPKEGKRTLWQIPNRKKSCDKNNLVGTRGRHIVVEVNHLALNFKKLGLAYHYDCDFKPDVPKKMLRLAIEEVRKARFPARYPAFDGRKNLYSSGPLPFNDQITETVQVLDSERDKPKEFCVTIKLVSTVDLSQIKNYLSGRGTFPQDVIQAVDIALRRPASIRFTQVGRSFFTPPKNQIISLGNGLELWYGFYQSAILGWRPFLNVDVAHKGFPEAKSLLNVMLDIKGKYKRYFNDPNPTYQDLIQQGLQNQELADFNKFIKGLKVNYMLPNQPNTRRVYKMNGTRATCTTLRFKAENGQTKTIAEYFDRDKHCALKFPNLPAIHVGPIEKDICLPPEFCHIVPGQVINRKLDENQTAVMVKAAARPANERKDRILQAMQMAGFNKDPCVNEFGITVSDHFEKVNARILNPPTLEYAGNNKVHVDKGVWRAKNFYQTTTLEKWVVMTLASRGNRQQLNGFSRTMIQQGGAVGMRIAEPYKYVVLCEENRNIRLNSSEAVTRAILPYFSTFLKEGAQLAVIVIPDRPAETYSRVKLAAEISVGLLTQCLRERTLNKMNPATAGNILLKINAKLNGINHVVDRLFCPSIMNVPVMLVGADVTHPSPDQTKIPSVAAVAASHDRRGFQYNMIWRLQESRMEIIGDLETIMRDQLMFFYKKTHQKPLKVIFYRDGVSEGQFSQVLEMEMSAIRRACTRLEKEYQPKVTFLVVQKRHHTRFFPTNKQDEDGRNRNVPPGTIVDTVITHHREMDFYLVSHASLQGTSRPTKYHKLWDENDLDEDDLEELTYYLCHLFSRCNRSVSYPAPTYYAHLAATRGRAYLEGAPINLEDLDGEMRNRAIKTTVSTNSPMFFV